MTHTPDALGLNWDPQLITIALDPKADVPVKPTKAKLKELNRELVVAVWDKNEQEVLRLLAQGASTNQKPHNKLFWVWFAEVFDTSIAQALYQSNPEVFLEQAPKFLYEACTSDDPKLTQWFFSLPEEHLEPIKWSLYESALSARSLTGLNAACQLAELFPRLYTLEDTHPAEAPLEQRSFAEHTKSTMTQCVDHALSLNHQEFLVHLTKFHVDPYPKVWEDFVENHISGVTYEQCVHLNTFLKSNPKQADLLQSTVPQSRLWNRWDQSDLDSKERSWFLKHHQREIKNTIESLRVLGWSNTMCRQATEYVPPTFVHALIQHTAPAVRKGLQDPQFQKVFDEAITSPVLAYHFISRLYDDDFLQALTDHPALENWRDTENNTLGHYFLRKSSHQTKKLVMGIYQKAPSWFEVENSQKKTLVSFLKWSNGDTQSLNALITQKLMTSGIKKAGITPKASKTRSKM